MLNRLLPDQISKFWDIIRYAVEQSLPPAIRDGSGKMNRILAAALSDKVDVWASYSKNDDSVKFNGIVLTKILYDDISDTKNLLIYCLFGYGALDSSSWLSGLRTLTKYARSKDCSCITAYTVLPNIIEISKRLGADTNYTFISFDVAKIIQKLNDLD